MSKQIDSSHIVRPGLRTRAAAKQQHEVPTTQLEAFRRAGSAVFDLALVVDQRRTELAAQGRHPWDADDATRSLLLAAWTARALQTMGSELLDSDGREDPRTAGFVPQVTHQQIWNFFEPVAAWINLARRAAASPHVFVGLEVELPATLPPLLSLQSGPRKHLKGLLTAGDAMDHLLEQELGVVLNAGRPPARYAVLLGRLEELAAQARASLHYAQGLWDPRYSDELATVILGHLYPALVLEFHLGQFLALPELVVRYRAGATPP